MILDKRNQLEQFISEQILGPGISGYRFINVQDKKLLSNNLLEQKPIDFQTELINIVPAGVYSTGILFPINNDDGSLTNPYEKETIVDDEGNIDESMENDEENDAEIDQLYPNAMGFTCCFNDEVLKDNNLSIKLNARYYKKIDRKEPDFNLNYGVLCECNINSLQYFIESNNLNPIIQIIKENDNCILQMNRVPNDQLSEIRVLLRSINQNKSDELQGKLKEFNFQLKAKSLSSLKQSCYNELKYKCIDNDKRKKLYSVSQEIEEIENFISHIDDLIDINDSRSFGLWQSNPIEIDIPFPEKLPINFEGKKIYSYNDKAGNYRSLRNIFYYDLGDKAKASLSINFQLSKDSRRANNKIFLKVQLVNTSTPFEKKPDDSRYYSTFNEVINHRAFFGVKLSVTNKYLIPYNTLDFSNIKGKYNEDEVTKFIYRQFSDYGIGHGCSVKWNRNEDHSVTIETEYIPICDTPDVDSTPRNKQDIILNKNLYEPAAFFVDSNVLEFKWLSLFSQVQDHEVIRELKEFVNLYESWIQLKRKKYQSESDSIRNIAFQELDKCMTDKVRMSKNIDLFLSGNKNSTNLESFRVMNAAMFMQLWHSVMVKNDDISKHLNDDEFKIFDFEFYKNANDEIFENGVSASWRPFQLAFILLNLDGIFKDENDDSWEKRNEYVDLVWFPTGGGKTEAYLGIIALTIINRRRLHGDYGGGTAVIMRYTLRLLTLQQFQRATLLIMAIELLRRWDLYDLGKEPIFIGLWVGDNSLPNNMEGKGGLIEEFQKLSEGQKSKVPYNYCPWCKSKLSPSNQKISETKDFFHYNRLHLKCSNDKCSFSFLRPSRARKDQGPIPVSLCDVEIYQQPPALLFGTVDKFAQLAHKVSEMNDQRNKDSRRIFGKGDWENGKSKIGYLPPDLIIQDELHLLLGPLGSAVALFESAIEQLCTRQDGTRAKIISSTATTRNTELQIMALFDRYVNLFPKPGVECDDSFFAFYKRVYTDLEGDNQEYISKRRYLGILPTGRTQIWMQMRLAAIMMTHRAIFELQQLKFNNPLDIESYDKIEKTMDYYHTVVSYFNSLKEVGKTESQIFTYVLKEIRRVFNRVIRPKKLIHALYTYSIRKGELTGRLSGEEVKNELDNVSSKWIASKRFAYVEGKEIKTGTVPPDFVVATNMISVGIDVSRFNLMIMNSMPRNIAEYIQASSRVARDSYGFVLTIHHPFRARDISHYEKFIEFHEKMYSYVEPISITPFTKKAVERYLGLYLATMLRHTTGFTNRKSAGHISQLDEKEILDLSENISNYFKKRKEKLASSQVDELVKNLLKEDNLITINNWIKNAIKEWQYYSNKVILEGKELVFSNRKSNAEPPQEQLYVDIDEYEENIHSDKWQVPMSLRVIEPEAALKIKLK